MIVDELIALLGYKIDDKDELKKFNKSLDDLTKKAYELGRAIRTSAIVAGTAAAAGFAFLGKSVIDTSAKFETYQTTLETIEGSAEKAKASMDWVTNFAKTTPFDVDQATEAFVKLKAYGIDPLKDDTLKTIGDTASAMGKDLMQAVEAWADAMTGENERLKEFGVKAKKEGEKITYTWTENGKEVKKTIKDNREEILKFLNTTMGKRFAGAMDRQSKTWKGMVSNLGDTWMGFLKRIGEAGFFEDTKRKLRELMDLFDRWDSDGTAAKWAGILSRAFVRVSDAIAMVARRIATHLEFLSKNLAAVKPYIVGLGTAIAALFAIMFPWVTLLGAAALALDDLFTYLEGGESAIGKFIEAMKQLLPFSAELNETLAKIGLGAGAAFAAAFILAPKTMLKGFGSVLIGILRMSLAGLALLSPVGWGVLLTGIGIALVTYFWDDIKAAFSNAAAKVQEIFGALGTLIKAIKWQEVGVAIMNSIWEGMKSVGESIKGWFQSLVPDWAKGFMGIENKNAPTGSYAPGGVAPQPDGKPSAPSVKPLGPQPGPPTPSAEMIQRAMENLKKTQGSGVAGSVVNNDHRQDNREYPVTVQAPVTVNVQQATDAPGQVGSAIAGAVTAGANAQPSRMQSGNTP